MLNHKAHPLPTRQPHLSPTRPHYALDCLCLLGLALLSGCGKTPELKKSVVAPAAATATLPSEVSNAKIDAEISKDLNNSVPSVAFVPSRESELTVQAEDILARHPDKNAAELLNVPEVNEKLRNGLKKLGADPELGKQISSTVELAAKLKGLEGTPGSARLDLDIKSYDRARTARMLETVLSEDPKRIVSFLVEEIGEAAPQLSYGGVQRASNGIAIESNPPTSPAPPK